ncbi:MAG: 3-dehydroquinate synthase [Proteobacteria bacterium]|nr:3-dehydroquinate synthase [Pseudomonadota bacterium]
MDTITVDLGRRSYEILIEELLLDKAGSFIRGLHLADSTAIITNTTIAPLYADRLAAALQASGFKPSIIKLPDGEQFKTLAHIQHIYSDMLAAGLDRQSLLIALGGGVIGDMTGFAAATFMRGIPCIQIPTTLLAQVDSSVGGKTGVNLAEGKNLVGAFHQPRLVLIDPKVLFTLPVRELQSGTAEVIKTAIIHDALFFEYLEHNTAGIARTDMAVLQHIITTCCRIKAKITSQDETEQGIRAFLNFGHTIGHAIETLTGYETYTHGEAVAIGMAAIARLSLKLGFCCDCDADRIVALLQLAGLPTALPCFSAAAYVDAILKDKKKRADTIKMVFLKEIGVVFSREITAQQLHDLLINECNLE